MIEKTTIDSKRSRPRGATYRRGRPMDGRIRLCPTTIEECAKVAEKFHSGATAALAIRALKEKP